jgi:hypothetical protein
MTVREEQDRRRPTALADRLCIRDDVERLIGDTEQTKEVGASGGLRANAPQRRERAMLSERRRHARLRWSPAHWRASSAAPSDAVLSVTTCLRLAAFRPARPFRSASSAQKQSAAL